jgi:hypothetical protein
MPVLQFDHSSVSCHGVTSATKAKMSSSDPVAEKSAFLEVYMSSHPDTLVAYAKFYGEIQEDITSAEMTAIDSKVRWNFVSIRENCLISEKEHDSVIQHKRNGRRWQSCSSNRPTLVWIQ